MPATFSDFLAEPAFEPGVATFCLRRYANGGAWQIGPEALIDPRAFERTVRAAVTRLDAIEKD